MRGGSDYECLTGCFMLFCLWYDFAKLCRFYNKLGELAPPSSLEGNLLLLIRFHSVYFSAGGETTTGEGFFGGISASSYFRLSLLIFF